MQKLYSLGIYCYTLFLRLVALFNNKARRLIQGHKHIFDDLKSLGDAPVIWFHVASLGEFEQGRPVLEEVRKRFPNQKLLLTFFSPSGYDLMKNYDQVDVVTYMPFDTAANARRFLKTVNISCAVFVKYEFWFNHLIELQKGNIPALYFSSAFRSNQVYFTWYGKWMLNVLKGVSFFFVQNVASRQILLDNDILNVEVCKDTRLTRVVDVSQESFSDEIITDFIAGQKAVVFGSTWPADHDLIINWYNSKAPSQKVIIAPHELSSSELNRLSTEIREAVSFYSNYKPDSDVLIIDKIGLLKFIYRYASCSYIGGGFGKGIHNILEAAVYGQPVFFGPNFNKFQEAQDLIDLKIAQSIKDQSSFNDFLSQDLLLVDSIDYFQGAEQSVKVIVEKIAEFH